MTSTILMAKRLSSNDTSSIARLIEINLRFYLENSSPFEEGYLIRLKTIAGLGFAVSLIQEIDVTYQHYLDVFLKYRDFKQNKGCLTYWCQSIADMMTIGYVAFQCTPHQRYYEEWKEAVQRVLKTVHTAEYEKEIDRLLEIMMHR